MKKPLYIVAVVNVDSRADIERLSEPICIHYCCDILDKRERHVYTRRWLVDKLQE